MINYIDLQSEKIAVIRFFKKRKTCVTHIFHAETFASVSKIELVL